MTASVPSKIALATSLASARVGLGFERIESSMSVAVMTVDRDFVVTGVNLPDSAVARAIQMSHEKYCSASIMIGKTAEITTSFEVVAA